MVKTNGQGIEAIALRRAAVADADKVRYRVYRTADDFIAVIAESALMAVKVSGITEPYRIVRDLPTEGISIKAERMAKAEAIEQVMIPVQPKEKRKEIAELAPAIIKDFVAMELRDLDKHKRRPVRVLSAAGMVASLHVAPEPEPEPEPKPQAPSAPVEPVPASAIQNETLTPDDVAALLGSSGNV